MEYAQEHLNFFVLCHVLTDILNEGLRTIFKQEWDNRFKETLGEWKDEPRNGMDFYNRESPRKQRRYAHLLDTMTNGDRAEWDCTRLFYAILFSDCIDGLNPVVQSFVDDLRKIRNEDFARVPKGWISDEDFQIAISRVQVAFESLGLSTLPIENARNHVKEYTDEQLNYFCICYVTTVIISEGLRTIFKQEWDNRYKTTLGEWKDEPRNGMDFCNRESPRNQRIYAHQLATMTNGDRAEWDCTRLFYAILFSDCIRGLNPVVQSFVDDLRKFRNEDFAHRPKGQLSDPDFQIALGRVYAAFQGLGLSTSEIQEVQYQRTIRLKRPVSQHSDATATHSESVINDQNLQSIPLYILARGDEAKAAYQRALETGETSDQRVKVFLVGQDRSGKTSVGRSLKGEQFRKDESSTEGVQMDIPLKYVGTKPWKNSTEEQEMTSFQHKCALHISDHLSRASSEEKALNKKELTAETATASESPLGDELQGPQERKMATKDTATRLSQDTEGSAELENCSKRLQETSVRDNIPQKITQLTAENLLKKKPVNNDGVWPVILDFAGQAIYRAIHPLFTSREAIYVLIFDLRKDLSVIARCLVKEPHYSEAEIPAPDSSDTNLDHMMRWMDLVNSFKHVENGKMLPPVILVGTHADRIEGDLNSKKKCVEDVKEKICDTARDFSEHIGKTFAVNNTLAGKGLGEEDPQIVRLREEVLKVGEGMPHTKLVVPIRWLQVEDEVHDLVSKGTNYITRQDFKENTCDDICQFEIEGDFEVLLNFLHDRGTVVYHGRADQPDSLVVLNPKWLVDVLCQIITVEKQSEETTIIRNLRNDLGKYGILHPDLLHDACERLKLANIKESLLAIMKMFNLLCEYTRKGGCSIFLVPCMLTSKAEDELRLNTFGNQDPAPLYITFSTQYVPGGLFSRLVVLFVEFAAEKIECDQPKLFANFARFFVGEFTGIDFVCYKRVIKVLVWDHNNTNLNPVEKEPDVCSEVLSLLKISLTRLHEECHWLRKVSWDLCARCELCPPEFVSESGECVWHGKQGCKHDDCVHYVSLTRKPVRCSRTDGPKFCPPMTWIQALEDITGHKQPFLQTLYAKLTHVELGPAEELSSTLGCKKRAPCQDTHSLTPAKQARTVAPSEERCYTVGCKREALDQFTSSVTPAKVARTDSECRESDEETQLTIAIEEVTPPGTILKENTVISDDLESLSISFGKGWKWLGRRLNIAQAKLDSIQVDVRYPDLDEKALQMLQYWRSKEGSKATYKVLCLALCHKHVNRRDLAETICFRKVS